MSDDIAINVQNLSKVYKLYNSPVDRLKESLHPLRKTYHHDFYALNDVSFEIKKGDSVGIIGKNGSGKSTLLKILTGVLTPTSGSVQIHGKISALLELGAGFNPELTGIENAYFNGLLMGYTREEMDKRLDAILSFADISEFVYQPVKNYSSGMFVRLAFAVAVNVDPEILIIDEALAVGDAIFQAKCYAKINEFATNKTVVLVTHDMSSVQSICNKCIVLDKGAITYNGIPSEATLIYYKLCRNISITRQTNSNCYAAIVDDISFYNNTGDVIDELLSGEEFTVELNIAIYKQILNLAAGLLFRTIQGMKLFGFHSYHNCGYQFGVVEPGRIKVSFKTRMLLAPGTYLLSIGLADQKNHQEFRNVYVVDSFKEITVIGDQNVYGVVVNKEVEIKYKIECIDE